MTNLLLKLFVKDYQSTEKEEVRKRYGLLGSYYGLITNFLLFLAKIVIGVLMRMYSIVADSVNNLSDFGNNFLSIFGFKISAKAADTDHPFGHQRMEYVISLIISCVIIALGVVMGYQGTLDLIAFVEVDDGYRKARHRYDLLSQRWQPGQSQTDCDSGHPGFGCSY
jgi:divalent metal cation (Fe/Co/Zn/Cd) transporter